MTNYLRTIRRRRKLTQAQLAQKSHVAQNTISKLEANPNIRPAHATVEALAEALGIEQHTLRFGPDPRRKRERLKELAAAAERAAQRLRRVRRQLKDEGAVA